jgi:hypothetical protein
MTITALALEMQRADSAAAQFLVRVTVSDADVGCSVTGRVVGPRAAGISTVEIAYPLSLVEAKDALFIFRGVIPEPNLWTAAAPFTYEATVELWCSGTKSDTRTATLALRGK